MIKDEKFNTIYHISLDLINKGEIYVLFFAPKFICKGNLRFKEVVLRSYVPTL